MRAVLHEAALLVVARQALAHNLALQHAPLVHRQVLRRGVSPQAGEYPAQAHLEVLRQPRLALLVHHEQEAAAAG